MTGEQRLLLHKAAENLRASRLLADQKLYDISISRAYYVMFYVAEAILLSEGLAFSKHSAVIAGFGKAFVKTGRVPAEFHRYLIDGERNRNISDYDIQSPFTGAEAAEQIDHAEKFFGLAEQLIGPTSYTGERNA
jgi:uncharacterized protein (UPF0332 family)